ncbi:MAG TPA: hypothetical protein VI316_06735, partial [Candidatus Dormibacteraeota bacterium]
MQSGPRPYGPRRRILSTGLSPPRPGSSRAGVYAPGAVMSESPGAFSTLRVLAWRHRFVLTLGVVL